MPKQTIDEFFDSAFPTEKIDTKLVNREILIATVTETIQREMDRANLGQVDLARSLNRSKGFISQLLNGRRNMTLSTLSDISSALGVKPNFYMTPADSQNLVLVSVGEPISNPSTTFSGGWQHAS